TLRRFAEIRTAHVRGERAGRAEFRILSNVAPRPSLACDVASDGWPTDVQLVWPGGESEAIQGLPSAWTSLAEALRYCVEAASKVPFASIAPETLVWKLAARVQF